MTIKVLLKKWFKGMKQASNQVPKPLPKQDPLQEYTTQLGVKARGYKH